jgi:hypothetical protein
MQVAVGTIEERSIVDPVRNLVLGKVSDMSKAVQHCKTAGDASSGSPHQ